jgi:hypothetical protein
MLTPDQFNQMQIYEKKNVAGWQFLMQSAGGPPVPANFGPGRNAFFSNDYYIDNLTIETQLLGKGTAGPHNTTALSFTVTEPNGFTLIENLYNSAVNLFKQHSLPALPSWQQTQYVLVIRFYGYDDAGNLTQVGINGQRGSPNVTDNRAVIEKFFPFTIADLTTKIVNKAVEYQITGAPTPYTTALASQRGSIPFNFELVGTTVGEVLNGRPVGTVYITDDGRQTQAAPATGTINGPAITVGDMTMKEQAAIAAGTAPELVNDDGMAFGGGGL